MYKVGDMVVHKYMVHKYMSKKDPEIYLIVEKETIPCSVQFYSFMCLNSCKIFDITEDDLKQSYIFLKDYLK